MSEGKVFVRVCRGCSKRHQTADQSGKTRCDACIANPPKKKKGAPAEAPKADAPTKPDAGSTNAIPPPAPTVPGVDELPPVLTPGGDKPKKKDKPEG